jgi:DNA-binding PadR family transcriptional regulator
MELSSTAHVILGLLRLRPRTGYEIKAAVDRSTRFFWAASYGQIYPELKRLASLGLVRGSAEAQGKRRRTVYSLTARGHDELVRWLEQPVEVFELRDEGLLKLFFADALPDDAAVAALEAKRDRHAGVVERLREIERGKAGEPPSRFPPLVLRFGIEMNEWISEWCDAERKRIAAGARSRRAAA